MLAERKLKQNGNRIKAGEAWNNPLNLVFTNALGGHYVHNTLSHKFKRIVDSISLPDRRFHDLRHTYAVLSIQSGVDIKTVQESLGHHTAAFTHVYGHVTERMKSDAAARLEATILGAKLST
ncbi:MAG: tyrosine-type recombinase/integrase [Christensenellales bacterium]